MNNTKSVSASPSQSKAAHERQTRQESFRAKFGNRPHMIIPQEDFEFIRNKSLSVHRLWNDCWCSDPYGSRWVPLNHSLKPSSFFAAKKILSEQGLFLFSSRRSIRDNRETVCWYVLNLHGARRNDYWLKSTNLDSADLDCNSKNLDCDSRNLEIDSRNLESISIETQTQQGLQNPSETLQEAP